MNSMLPTLLAGLAVGLGFALLAFRLRGGGAPAPTAGDAPELLRERIRLEKEVTRLETENRALQARLDTQRGELAEAHEQMKTQFENLAGKILETNSQKFREFGEKSFLQVLTPFREKVLEFQKTVQESYHTESRERFALKEELKRIVELNQRMTTEATNLTRALKADVKAQGNWGELILERLLEQSGLRKGHEYTIQGEGLGLKTEGGDHQRPDVILNLPDGKHVIIDSKVSLKSYEMHASAEAAEARDAATKAFLQSVYKHVDGLSGKNYASLTGLSAPDFVLLFMPLEPAFALALQSDGELVSYAWNKRVAFVSPTTLLVTLGTVASLWKTERQNKNALEIARQGGNLYDKFVAFTQDLERVGKSLEDSQRAYGDAVGKLRDGKGNLVARAETLRKLGAKTTKELSAKLTMDEDLDAPAQGSLLPPDENA